MSCHAVPIFRAPQMLAHFILSTGTSGRYCYYLHSHMARVKRRVRNLPGAGHAREVLEPRQSGSPTKTIYLFRFLRVLFCLRHGLSMRSRLTLHPASLQ